MNVTLKRLRPVYSVFNPTWMDLSNEKLAFQKISISCSQVGAGTLYINTLYLNITPQLTDFYSLGIRGFYGIE